MSIGIILSAPMGPIGIMCVQRTLNNGRESGFFTGVGAAASDLFYCLLTGLGISMVTSLIEDNETTLQIIGSIVLIIYGLYMMIHDPLKNKREEIGKKNDNNIQDAVTGFLLTLSNPLIMFLIIPLFARFGFPLPEHRYYHIIVGFVFIVVGALLWWAMITYVVDKVRSRFNERSLLAINRVMGSVILVLSIYGLLTGLQAYLSHQGTL